VPIAYVYTSFILRSIFLALNIDMQWIYQGKPVKELPDWVAGFVYEITNTQNGKKYIGKKLARFRRVRKPLKGRINKRRFTIESDWKNYFGSSNALLEDIEKIGKDKFTREILFYCKSRAECNYVEAREQFARKVLETDRYYNGHIRVRVHKQVISKK
jgi:hypothetical protein